jgi:hypothetical protein
LANVTTTIGGVVYTNTTSVPLFQLVDAGLWDTRIWGLIALFSMFIVTVVSMSWEVKVQIGLFVLMTVSILSLVIGSFANTVTTDRTAAGYYGWRTDLFLYLFLSELFLSVLIRTVRTEPTGDLRINQLQDPQSISGLCSPCSFRP